MYEDLRELDGSSCASEPEFRAYEVLMNLNDGDVLRAILTLEDWVREAPEVRTALDAFMALSSRNYVRFFKLVSLQLLLFLKTTSALVGSAPNCFVFHPLLT